MRLLRYGHHGEDIFVAIVRQFNVMDVFASDQIVQGENVVGFLLLDKHEIGVIGCTRRLLHLKHALDIERDFEDRIAIGDRVADRSNNLSNGHVAGRRTRRCAGRAMGGHRFRSDDENLDSVGDE